MREISALEISALVKELQGFLGFYIDKFYDAAGGRFRVRISKRGEKADLIFAPKCGIWKASEVESADAPSNFAMAARKRISGFAIGSIAQLANDRIIVIELSKKEDTASLILEMHGQGNMILTDGDMKITLAYLQEDFRDRKIRVGEAYLPPKNDFVAYDSLDELVGRVHSNEGKNTAMSFLSRNVNMGALYLEDALIRAGINPKGRFGQETIEDAIVSIKAELEIAGQGKYILYLENGAPKDYALCSIEKYSALEKEEFKSLGELLESFYKIHQEQVESHEEKELKASIERQKELMAETASQIESNKAAGETIFRNMDAINRLIAEARKNKRVTKEELSRIFNDMKVLEVDLKKKSVTIEID